MQFMGKYLPTDWIGKEWPAEDRQIFYFGGTVSASVLEHWNEIRLTNHCASNAAVSAPPISETAVSSPFCASDRFPYTSVLSIDRCASNEPMPPAQLAISHQKPIAARLIGCCRDQ